jgi:DNA invertase Pin-like site-specific DNA recombinase
LAQKGVGFKVLSGHGASIDTTTPAGKLVFGIFAALAEFERELFSNVQKQGWHQLVPAEGQVGRLIK